MRGGRRGDPAEPLKPAGPGRGPRWGGAERSGAGQAAAMALRGGGRWARLASALRAGAAPGRGGSSGRREGGRLGDTPQHRELRAALRKVPPAVVVVVGQTEGRGGETDTYTVPAVGRPRRAAPCGESKRGKAGEPPGTARGVCK